MSTTAQYQLARFGLLLQLQRRARQASAEELPFILVNETLNLIPYRQALLWTCPAHGPAGIAAVSGLAVPEARSPFLLWFGRLVSTLVQQPDFSAIRAFSLEDVPEEEHEDWRHWLPAHGLWLPLYAPGQTLQGVLVLFRDAPWSEAESHVLGYLSESYAQALALLTFKQPARVWWRSLWHSRRRYAVFALLVAALFWPIRQSVLSGAEIIPEEPILVRAPLEGVIKEFYVQPNQAVAAGQKLLALDDVELQSKLGVAEQVFESVRAEYLQAAQKAVFDREANAELAVLQNKIEQQETEVRYLKNLLARIEITAPAAGIVIFDDPYDWLGKPVVIGEKIVAIADPDRPRLGVDLPVTDAIELPENAEVLFFPNTAPAEVISAHLTYIGYHARLTPSQIMAYRLKADFNAGEPKLRIGLKGTAKVFGGRTPLILWVLRRPISLIEQWLN